MRALMYCAYGSPDVLELAEIETPTPGDREVRVRIHAAAVTTADCAFRLGDPMFARLATGLLRPKQPILGTELAGEIDAVGAQVTRFRVGDRVFAASGIALGAHAEYICLPENGALALQPTGVTHAGAAAICEGTLTALPFLRDSGRIQRGQQVLINGASGSVGTAAVQLARHFGAEVTGVCSAANVELVRSLGADHVIDYADSDFTRAGRTYDIVFDAVGKSSFSRCRASLKPNGIYLTTVPTMRIFLEMLWTSTFGGKRAIIAFTGLRAAEDKARDLRFVAELVEAGALRPVIAGCYSMEHARDAHRLVETGHKKGSAVLQLAPLEP